MNIIDPGRYKNFTVSKSKIKYQNDLQLDKLIDLILYSDFIKYKPVGSKRKSIILREIIKDIKKNMRYSEFFSSVLNNYSDVDGYVKTLGKYIK